jgi:hypothetical protein
MGLNGFETLGEVVSGGEQDITKSVRSKKKYTILASPDCSGEKKGRIAKEIMVCVVVLLHETPLWATVLHYGYLV